MTSCDHGIFPPIFLVGTEVLRTRVGDVVQIEWRTHRSIGNKECVILATIGSAKSLRLWELVEKEVGNEGCGGAERFELRMVGYAT